MTLSPTSSSSPPYQLSVDSSLSYPAIASSYTRPIGEHAEALHAQLNNIITLLQSESEQLTNAQQQRYDNIQQSFATVLHATQYNKQQYEHYCRLQQAALDAHHTFQQTIAHKQLQVEEHQQAYQALEQQYVTLHSLAQQRSVRDQLRRHPLLIFLRHNAGVEQQKHRAFMKQMKYDEQHTPGTDNIHDHDDLLHQELLNDFGSAPPTSTASTASVAAAASSSHEFSVLDYDEAPLNVHPILYLPYDSTLDLSSSTSTRTCALSDDVILLDDPSDHAFTLFEHDQHDMPIVPRRYGSFTGSNIAPIHAPRLFLPSSSSICARILAFSCLALARLACNRNSCLQNSSSASLPPGCMLQMRMMTPRAVFSVVRSGAISSAQHSSSCALLCAAVASTDTWKLSLPLTSMHNS